MKKRFLIIAMACLFISSYFIGSVYADENKIIDFMKYIWQKIEAINSHAVSAPPEDKSEPININITIETDQPKEIESTSEEKNNQKSQTEKETINIKDVKTGVTKKEEQKEEKNTEIPKKKTAPNPLKGIYLTADTMGSSRGMELIDELIKNGGNAVVIDIEHGGGLLAFTPKNELLKEQNPGRSTLDGLPETIKELHKKGVYVIARQVVFNDPYMSTRKPEWRIKNKWGGEYDYRWLDPSVPGVQLYNINVMQEVAEMGFDEVQFDYIRFPAANHNYLDYNYDEEKFTRVDVINEYLMKARNVADTYGIQISVDVFGAIVWGDVDWKIVGQKASEMAKYVDAIYPMTYPSHVSPGYYGFTNPYGQPYSFIHDSIQRFVEAADGNAEIRTWVQGFPLRIPSFGTWFMEDQIKASFDAGASGYTIWSPGNHYTYSWPAFKIDPEKKEELSTDDVETSALAQ